ncbi:hypothetical protein CVT25_015740 [Psilocybe cyanescens]|uniref:BTB domain-containing protein n=1 Tax=Psilocybe cyanescens TaxID=93625 RepID=A0A409WRW5_PSICY|nr:hypothetical protein CVT25_015740 [Psilocybe cyanescens]
MIPPCLPPASVYTSCYCEENTYLLCQAFLDNPAVKEFWQVFVIVISNDNKTVSWDWMQSPEPNRRKNMFRVVPGELFCQYFASDRSHMLLKAADASFGVDCGGSLYSSAPPLYAPICGPSARREGISNNLMSNYVFMKGTIQDFYGVVGVRVLPGLEQTRTVRSTPFYLLSPVRISTKMSSIPSTSSSTNGHSHPNGSISHSEISTESSFDGNSSSPSSSTYPINGYSQPFQNSHNEEIVSHLYHAGFQTGNYADTILHVHQNVYRLHAIILSRSPYLAHLMSTSPQTTGQRVIYVHLDQEPEVTQEGFAIALGYLYSAISLNLIRPENSRAVLAAGCLLGGMDELSQYAYNVCRRSMSVETIGGWVEFIDAIPSNTDGAATSDLPSTSVFGQYAQRLRDDVFHFLVVTLPEVLEVQRPAQDPSSGPSGRDVLLQIYSRVPFEMFKSAVESPTFLIGSDQARFKFAKDAIELRKRGIARGLGAEETVVLAFGQSSFGSSAVHITRKMRKRPLWKVNS